MTPNSKGYVCEALVLRRRDRPRVRDASGNDHYYLQDANFNVTAVTDNTGAVKERYAYTPYGEVTILDADFSADSDNKSDISNEHLYTGRRLDPETGLQLNRNRFYAAGLGRWVNRDPIGYEGGGYNLYEYVNGMPLGGLDPDGKYSLASASKSLLFQGKPLAATSDLAIFNEWYRLEMGNRQWLHTLPRCPSKIKKCSSGWKVKKRPSNAWVKLNSALWNDPVSPGRLEKALHPSIGARKFTWSLRSVTFFNHTNQCTYDKKGIQFRAPPTAGTADLRPSGTATHFLHDVAPILSANTLDGGWQGGVIMAGGLRTIKTIPGPRMRKYYRARPRW